MRMRTRWKIPGGRGDKTRMKMTKCELGLSTTAVTACFLPERERYLRLLSRRRHRCCRLREGGGHNCCCHCLSHPCGAPLSLSSPLPSHRPYSSSSSASSPALLPHHPSPSLILLIPPFIIILLLCPPRFRHPFQSLSPPLLPIPLFLVFR